MIPSVPSRCVLASLLLLGGCASGGSSQKPDFFTTLFGSSVPAPPPRTGLNSADREALAKAAPGRKPSKPLASLPAPTEPIDAAEPYDPSQLVGMNGESLLDLLGTPADQREQASGLVWTFRQADCELAVVLYSSVDGRDLRVLQYSVAGNLPDQDPEGAMCVGRMVRDARSQQS